jgi:integrase
VAELDLDASDPCWTIAGVRTEKGVMHRVPLTPLAVEIYRAAVAGTEQDERDQKVGKTPFVFPGRGTDEAAIDPHAVTRAMSRLMASLEIENATVHDLRRTVGTNLARQGVSKDIRARLLDHVDGARSVTDSVDNQQEFGAEKRAAMEVWEAEVRRIVSEDLVRPRARA